MASAASVRIRTPRFRSPRLKAPDPGRELAMMSVINQMEIDGLIRQWILIGAHNGFEMNQAGFGADPLQAATKGKALGTAFYFVSALNKYRISMLMRSANRALGAGAVAPAHIGVWDKQSLVTFVK